MPAFDTYGSGNPTKIPAPAATVTNYLDTFNNAIWISTGQGWNPSSPSLNAKAHVTAQVANNTNILTYTVPVVGMYRVSLYEVSTNTPTGATLPAFTVVFTDSDSATVVTDTLADVTGVSAIGAVNQGQFLVSVAAAGTIVVATTSYAAGSGTALAYAVKVRVEYVG
jgi:hypothetical protein